MSNKSAALKSEEPTVHTLQRVLYEGKIVFDEQYAATIDCTVRALTEGGAHIRFIQPTPIPENVKLYVPRFRMAYDAVVVWTSSRDLELRFTGLGKRVDAMMLDSPLTELKMRLARAFDADQTPRDGEIGANSTGSRSVRPAAPGGLRVGGLEGAVMEAVEQQGFHLRYQPVINLLSGQISGFEALLRWDHPEYGAVPPSTLVPVCEDIGLIGTVGSWILGQACAEAARWPMHIKIAVNVSALQFQNRNLVADVMMALADSNLSPSRLELELTETTLLDSTGEVEKALQNLRREGVRIAIDDFGTGYASFEYLKRFTIDKIKLDRVFVTDLLENNDSLAITLTVAELGKRLGLTTVAEGVETEEQLKILRLQGFSEGQGYFFARPSTAAEARRLMEIAYR